VPAERPDPERRIETLLRTNAELAAELRSLVAERAANPRAGQIPSARGLSHLVDERDTLATRLEETEVALQATKADRDGLERQNQEMEAEIIRLRGGFAGFLRRLRARALSPRRPRQR